MGIGVWPTYKLNDELSLGVRVEMFKDTNNARIGAFDGAKTFANQPTGFTYYDIAVTPARQLS